MQVVRRFAVPVLSALAVSFSTSVSGEDLGVNRLLASQCAQCHGTNGVAVGDMDSLAGDQDLLADLLDMVGEDHIEDIMEHQAHGYDRLVLAPGVAFKPVEGWDKKTVPHAWIAGWQTRLLRNQLRAMPDDTPERIANITTNSACFSPITYDEASWLTAVFAYNEESESMELAGNSFGEAGEWNRDNFDEMFNWSDNLFADTFG